MLTRLQLTVNFSLFFVLSGSTSMEIDITSKQLQVPAMQDKKVSRMFRRCFLLRKKTLSQK